ncbi:MAG: ABC transporter permease [Armatimonadetes bacterium]|nr:ABC transporter permease [Armatimonadota bacterium]
MATPAPAQPERRLLWHLACDYGVVAGFVGLAFLLGIWTPHFFEPYNFQTLGEQVATNLILSLGMTVVILTGGIDLSVGSIVALSGVSAVMALTHPGFATAFGSATVPAAVGIGVLVGATVGLVNGLSVAHLGMPPFIVTLATMRICRGLAKQIIGGTSIGVVDPGLPMAEQLNANLQAIQPLGLGFPTPFLLALGVTVSTVLLLGRTRYGRHVYAIGGSEAAARLSGVPVRRVKLMAYLLGGLLAGLAGVMEAGKVQSGSPTAGEGFELNAIAAVVVGGTSLAGGRGSAVGTFVGAVFIIGVMNKVLGLHNVPPFYREVASGAIIFVTVLLDLWLRRKGA